MSYTLPTQTTMGAVHLTVADHGRSLAYYQDSIGLRLHRQEGNVVYLGAGGADLLILTEQPGARPTRGTTGLYHFALLVPSRLELASVLRHLFATQTPISGFADHAVSEAIYLTDPDGHGIEIYRDRPRAEWEYPDGKLKLVTEPFDAEGVLGELTGEETAWKGMHTDTRLGHIHLHVASIPAAEQFYRDVLGFDVMARYGSGASFVAAGGYHHHLGLNTWAGIGAPPPANDAARLLWYEIVLPDTAILTQLIHRLQKTGPSPEERDGRFTIQDPSGNGIILTTP